MIKNRLIALLASNRSRSMQPAAAIVRGAVESEVTVYLYDYIVATEAEAEWWGGVAAESLAKQVHQLQAETIHLRINSPGGDVFGGETIANAFRQHPANVIAHIDGLAASAATVVATAADEIEMAPGSMYMIHRAWTLALGNMNDMLAAAALLEKVDGTLAAAYARRTGAGADEMLALMDAETWFTAQEAVDAKFVDRVAAGAKAVSNRWDLGAYNRAPAASAPPLQSEEHRERQHQRMRLLDRVSIG